MAKCSFDYISRTNLKIMKYLSCLTLILLLISCENKPKKETSDNVDKKVSIQQEAVSFTGQPLYQREATTEALAKNDSLIALMNEKGSLSEEDFIKKAGYYVSTNRFRDAVDVYSEGLRQFPESYKLRRFRGHRYLSLRETEKAILDLNEAVSLLDENSAKELENDASGKPWGTYEHWIYYHIGLYHYLEGNYEEAAKAYQKCIDTAINGKNVVGPSDWLYNSLQKMGEPEKADAVIASITPDYDTDRDHPYFKRVMLNKGVIKPDEIMDVTKATQDWTAGDITIAYGLANWYGRNGDVEKADEIFNKILETPVWNTWAYVVTDKERSLRGSN